MNYQRIISLQKSYNVESVQKSINSGKIWLGEGSSGRFAMECLVNGVCMLPLKDTYDYFGNELPPRNVLKAGTKGTYLNSVRFWNRVEDGDEDVLDYLAGTFY